MGRPWANFSPRWDGFGGLPEGRGFTGCGKTRHWCHSERSEESLHLWNQANAEILPSFHSGPPSAPQDDSLGGFSAACSSRALAILNTRCCTRTRRPCGRAPGCPGCRQNSRTQSSAPGRRCLRRAGRSARSPEWTARRASAGDRSRGR